MTSTFNALHRLFMDIIVTHQPTRRFTHSLTYPSGGSRSSSKGGAIYVFHIYGCQVSDIYPDCSVFWTYIRMIVPDNASVNSSIFGATNIDTDNVRYFWESHLATLFTLSVQLPATLTNHRLKVASRKQQLGLYSEFQPWISHCLLV